VAAREGRFIEEDDVVTERLSYDEMAEIVDAHADALLLFARQWSDASAEDVVQEAFLQLVRRVKANDPPENVVSWLYRVIRNELITLHHGRRRSRAREKRVASERPGWFEPSVDTRLDASRAAEQLHRLPIEQREVVVARIWGGLSFEEIAGLTKTSRSTAHRRYLSAIDALRNGLS
jgi:RNA polymerase sigma-70 factor (ECF subfamily)